MSSILTPFPRPETAGARLMASAWSAFLAAFVEGDPAASAFAEWLAGFWEPSLERPAGVPDARTVFAADGRGIDWFERDGWVSGHIHGVSGGYLVPRVAIFAQPWMTALAPAA